MLSIAQEYSNHLEDIFENSHDYIYLHDRNGNILDINDVVIKNLGYSREEILSMNATDFLSIEEDVVKIEGTIMEAIQTGKVKKPKIYMVKKKDGNLIYIEVNTIPLKRNGEIYAILGIGHDVSEFKKVAQKLKESEERLKEKNIELSVLNRIITLGNESRSLQEFLEKSYDQVLDIVVFDRGGVYLYNTETHHNKLVLHKNVHPNFITAVEDVDISEGLFHKVFNKNNPFYIEDFSEFIEGAKDLGVFSAAIVPLRSKDEYVGSLNVGSPVHQVLSQNELELLVAIGKQMGIIIQKFKSEKLLKESEEKFKALFRGSPVPTLTWQKVEDDFLLIDYNKALEEYSLDDIRGYLTVEGSIFFRDRADILKDLYRCLNEKINITRETTYYVNVLEEERDLSIKFAYIPPDLVLMHVDDITERKKSEKELKESEEKFRTITQQSFEAIGIFQNNEIKFLNKAYEELTGFSLGEIYSMTVNELIDTVMTPEERERIKAFSKFTQSGERRASEFFESQLISKDDKKKWILGHAKSIIFQEKPAAMHMLFDITEKVKTEQELKESEEKFRNIAEQSFMGIFIVQAVEFKYMNKAMAKITGYPVEEMLNWSEKEIVKIIYHEDLDIVLKRLQSNIEGDIGHFSSNTFRIINRNGEVRWLEDYTTRIIYQGKVANLISVIDITDKKEAERLIIEENKRLLELHELRKDLITRVSHELKTPMTSIYGANQILIKLYLDEIGEDAQKYVEIGHRGCLRLRQLIDNLLDASRLDAKRFELKLQKENLVELIIDCVKDMKYLATNRQLKMKLELPDEAFLDIDGLRFRQVLTNIISNAIKNTPSEGKVFIDLVDNSKYIDIQVKDTGIGLTENEKMRLFEKFGKIERYGMDLGVDIEGSGLGLYIAKEIVELHGGQINVESEGRNKGSTFTIRLFKKE